jgi:hypothetical protein
VDKNGKCTYYRQFASWLWSKGQKEKAGQFLNQYDTIDWNKPEWSDANDIWKNAGPAMFGRERITQVDLAKMHQISLYTLTRAGLSKAAPAGVIEEADPVDETIMETRGFKMLMKGIRNRAAGGRQSTEASGPAEAGTAPEDVLAAAQSNAGVIHKALAWTNRAAKKAVNIWYQSQGRPAPTFVPGGVQEATVPASSRRPTITRVGGVPESPIHVKEQRE